MIRSSITPMIHWLRRVVTQPRNELDRWQKAVRFAYDLGRYGARQLRRDRAPQMAAALSFHTLFGLIPVLVVATILVRAIKGIELFLELSRDLMASAGLDQIQIRIAAPSEAVTDSQTYSITLADWLEDIIGQAANVNLSAVGWIGVAVIIYAAISLMVTIENSFNTIYRAAEGRSWTRRVPLYWFILTVGPVAIGLATYVDGHFDTWIESLEAWQWVPLAARLLWSFVFGWVLMFAVYALIPNTMVTLRPALAGAFGAAVLLEIGRRTMGAYLANAFSISQLYGSLGLVPLFMFWVYLTWLMVLFGLEVSATLQTLGGRKLEEIEPSPLSMRIVDPTSVVTIMEVVAEYFRKGQPVTARQIAEATSVPETTVALMIDRLVEARLLNRLQRDDDAVSLAKPPEHVSAEELVDIGFRLVDRGGLGRRSALLAHLREAQKSLAAKATLATLVPANPAASPVSPPNAGEGLADE